MTILGKNYIEKVLDKFSSNPISTILAMEQCLKSKEDVEYMRDVPYVSSVGSLICDMMHMKSDITHIVGVVSRFLSN